MTQDNLSTQQVFNGAVNAPNSQFGCNIYQEKPLNILFNDALNETRASVQSFYVNDVSTRQNLLTILNAVETHFSQNIQILTELLEQVSCQKEKKQEVKYSFFVHLIHFFVSTIFHHSPTILPKLPELATVTSDRKRWAFSAAASTALGLDHHLGAIADYIASDINDKIKDGDCFIFKLLTTINCDNCQGGKLINSNGTEKSVSGILLNFFKGNRLQSQSHNSDFFILETERRINFKCGECICNLTILDKSKGVL